MCWLNFLSSLFCGEAEAKLRLCNLDRTQLESDKAELQSRVDVKESEVNRLQSLCDKYVSRAEVAEADAARFYEDSVKAAKILELSDLSSRVLVDPWNMTQAQWKGVRCELISDDGYYAFPEDVWLRMLSPIQLEVERVLGRVHPETVDCDNFTLTMCDFVSLAFNRSGLNAQGAFMKLLSAPHSYCGFMLPYYTVRVYDPVSGEVVGWLGETGPGDYGVDTYRTQQAFFLA